MCGLVAEKIFSMIDTAPVLYESASDCCGCGSCMASCPTGAISMVCDSAGFIFPTINSDACVGCRSCLKACGLHKKLGQKTSGPWFAASGKGDTSKSASAGVFVSLAREVIAAGGCVVGAAYVRHEHRLDVAHIMVEDLPSLEMLQNSKYVQSDSASCFSNIRQVLESNRVVFFCGTPCQVAGLKGFLGHDYPNLLTADLVCHGVPSNELFNSWLAYEEKEYGTTISDICFRDKKNGWKDSLQLSFRLPERNLKVTIPAQESAYYSLFLSFETLRDSCYECIYAGEFRSGDLTLGDFWGVERQRPDLLEDSDKFNDDSGISCLLVNNAHGMNALEKYGGLLNLTEVSFNDIASGNDQLNHPCRMPADRAKCLKAFSDNGWAGVLHWWKIHHELPTLVSASIKKVAKGILPRKMWNHLRLIKARRNSAL